MSCTSPFHPNATAWCALGLNSANQVGIAGLLLVPFLLI